LFAHRRRAGNRGRTSGNASKRPEPLLTVIGAKVSNAGSAAIDAVADRTSAPTGPGARTRRPEDGLFVVRSRPTATRQNRTTFSRAHEPMGQFSSILKDRISWLGQLAGT
jgi:hypothetical protein